MRELWSYGGRLMNMINIAKLLKDLEADFRLNDIPARKAKLHRAFYYHNQGWQSIPAAQHAQLVERLQEMKDYEEEWFQSVCREDGDE